MSRNTKKQVRIGTAAKQKQSLEPQNGSVQNSARENISRGVVYIVITALILFTLLYVFPVILKFDISAFLQGEKQLGIMRVILGVVLLAVLVMSLIRIVNANTLEGESHFTGLKNALLSGQILRNLLSIMILTIGGIALIAWGITGIIS
ncbi:hypothetical protein [Atopobium sp. oral taxon 199]|uniref:hypothetical protein n=1 Tax=Atopobium sp. oral taxon 199 TaxID=712156 RepID=UPI00034E94C1|nr:hypothetical protein [Atopobium sp. oral taxon 199]EPD78585.1 hypothetical protein HMPREF1527_00909 [Atopobium sp. oral taxon 199 str. F0494]